MQRMRAIDLFCGTGGFSRGAHAAGFDVVAAYDIDPKLTHSFEKNFPDTKLRLTDVAQLSGEEIRKHIGGGHVDLIFGGPPCQGFSAIGRRDATDPRRTLLGHFFRIVSEVRPSAFVMENVEGLLFSDAVHELEEATVQASGYRLLETKVLNAANFGAATNRRRAFVIGYDPNQCTEFDWPVFDALQTSAATVKQALAGLASPTFVETTEEDFDVWRLFTATALITDAEGEPRIPSSWPYKPDNWEDIQKIYAPDLSARERYAIDRLMHRDIEEITEGLAFSLDIPSINSYTKFHRFYPTFQPVMD